MDITVYNKLFEAFEVDLDEFNSTHSYTATASKVPTTNTVYPLIVMTEIRNQPRNYFYSRREQVSSLGYKFDILAKDTPITLPDKTRDIMLGQTMCRELAEFICDFMQTKIGLNQISFNDLGGIATQSEIYQITVVFQQNHLDNREKFF